MKRSKQQRKQRRPRRIADLPLVAMPPRSTRVLMSYSSDIAANEAAAGLGVAYFYRLNSVYDPDFTGTGTSAVPYSTWSAVYQNYRVTSATVRLTITQPTGTAGTFSNVTVAPVAAAAVVPSNPAVWKMIPYSVTHRIGRSADGGKKLGEIKATFDVAKVLHLTRAEYKDSDYSAPNNNNPERQAFVGVLMQATGSSVAAGWVFQMNITYQVEWFNPYVLQ